MGPRITAEAEEINILGREGAGMENRKKLQRTD